MEEKFNELAKDKAITAREYFYILRLAIYHIDRKQLDSFVEVGHYAKTPQIYKCACRIAEAL